MFSVLHNHLKVRIIVILLPKMNPAAGPLPQRTPFAFVQ